MAEAAIEEGRAGPRGGAADRPKRRLSIPTRIFVAFALVIAAFAAVAITSVVQHARTAELLRLLNDGYLPLALRLGLAKAHQEGYWRQVERSVDSSPQAVRLLNAARQLRPSTQRQLDHYLGRAERLAETSGDALSLPPVRAALENVRQTLEETDDEYDRLFAALEAGDDAAASEAIEALRSRELAIGRHYLDAYNHIQDRAEAIGALAAERERQAAITLGLLVVMALLVGVIATWWSQRLLSPLPSLQSRVAAVAKGDLSPGTIEKRRDDELGRLAEDFEAMVRALAARDERLRELRRMQAQIVESLRAAIVVVGGDDDVRTVNPSAEAVLGLAANAAGQAVARTGLGERLPALGEAIESVRTNDEPLVLHEARLVNTEGKERFVDVLVTPFAAESGSVLIVADDVTDALHTKARLIQTERLAAIGRMAAHVTHEVRNPLSSIGLNVEMLEDEVAEDGEARALLTAIQKEIDRLSGLTDEYLRLARLPAPALEVDDVGDALSSVLSFVRREMDAAGVELIEERKGPLPPVAFDEAQLRQALLNLLRNAREAQTSDPWIRVASRPESDGVRIDVDDRGEGIGAEERARIFDLFFTTKERGSGLGLPLTQQIVAAHGGRIRCEARDGGGTRFSIWLPAA